MPGKPGRSGGKRSGAGRPQSKSEIRIGDAFAAVRHHPGGTIEMLPIATIIEVSASLIVISLSDGGTLRFAR